MSELDTRGADALGGSDDTPRLPIILNPGNWFYRGNWPQFKRLFAKCRLEGAGRYFKGEYMRTRYELWFPDPDAELTAAELKILDQGGTDSIRFGAQEETTLVMIRNAALRRGRPSRRTIRRLAGHIGMGLEPSVAVKLERVTEATLWRAVNVGSSRCPLKRN